MASADPRPTERRASGPNGATCNAHDQSGYGAPPAKIADPFGPVALAVNPLAETVYIANPTIEVGKGPTGVAALRAQNRGACDAPR